MQGGGTLLGLEVLDREVERGGRDLDGRARRLQRHHLAGSGVWGGLALSPPLGPLGFNSPNIAQRHALHVERTAETAFMLSDRV